ncbi:MAG: hypothetical protein GY755_23265 [Chloroflexi bacterium]|nr:hypothetical protein [Chloroflexota bacterium]
MHVVEFETVTDGQTIHIPTKYKELASGSVKVIIMTENHQAEKPKKRTPGSGKGLIFSKDGFEAPLLDKELL